MNVPYTATTSTLKRSRVTSSPTGRGIGNSHFSLEKTFRNSFRQAEPATSLRREAVECAVYGDYFYLEALTRYLKPDWKRYW